MCDLFGCYDCRHKCKDNATDREIEKLWEQLEDVPVDEDECLDIDWQGWNKGTHREEIWYWFDEHHSKGVGWLMNEYEPKILRGKNMDIEIYEKPVITKFVVIDGEEFELSELYSCLHQISETEENDRYGEYSLRDYELNDYETMNKLVKMGLVKNYTGSRMANLYCMKDKKGIDKLLNTLYELDVEF